MRLIFERHRVGRLGWDATTRLDAGGTLHVQRAALEAAVLSDPRIERLDCELVQAGESCRMLPVFDVVEPRAKLDPPGADFPGILSPTRSAGSGRTRVLDGLAVTLLDPTLNPRGGVLDLASPLDGQPSNAVNRYAALQHLVLIPRLKAGVSGDDARQALRLASLRAAVHLATMVELDGAAPAQEQVIDLDEHHDAALPRVAYVFQLHSHQHPTVAGEPVLYGDNVRHLLPTVLQPTEVLDGALVRPYSGMMMETYGIQNHAVLTELIGRHGRDLHLAGVVVYVANQFADERDRATVMASNLVRWTLRAQAAVFTKSGGGAPNVDMALIAERCEELGVKTSMLLWSMGGDHAEDSTLFNAPSLDAIISMGANLGAFDLPPVERVIAPNSELAAGAQTSLSVVPNRLLGVMDHLGGSRLTAVAY